MKKILKAYGFILSLVLLLTLSSCSDEPSGFDLNLVSGKWKVVTIGHPDNTAIYDFVENGSGDYERWGVAEVYYLSPVLSSSPRHCCRGLVSEAVLDGCKN